MRLACNLKVCLLHTLTAAAGVGVGAGEVAGIRKLPLAIRRNKFLKTKAGSVGLLSLRLTVTHVAVRLPR